VVRWNKEERRNGLVKVFMSQIWGSFMFTSGTLKFITRTLFFKMPMGSGIDTSTSWKLLNVGAIIMGRIAMGMV